jgi:hypothetical protein
MVIDKRHRNQDLQLLQFIVGHETAVPRRGPQLLGTTKALGWRWPSHCRPARTRAQSRVREDSARRPLYVRRRSCRGRAMASTRLPGQRAADLVTFYPSKSRSAAPLQVSKSLPTIDAIESCSRRRAVVNRGIPPVEHEDHAVFGGTGQGRGRKTGPFAEGHAALRAVAPEGLPLFEAFSVRPCPV